MRHALALHIAPLLLRVGLGVTFVWAGAAKLTQEMPVTDQNRAQPAAWGVIEGPAGVGIDVPEITPDVVSPDRELLEEGEPPLPAIVNTSRRSESCAQRPGSCSTIVRSWSSLTRNSARCCPTTPPPTITIRTAGV